MAHDLCRLRIVQSERYYIVVNSVTMKHPFKRIEININRAVKVIEIDLSRLEQHKNNIRKVRSIASNCTAAKINEYRQDSLDHYVGLQNEDQCNNKKSSTET